MKLGLALSGGGVRGAAHIGILKAMEENGIRPDYISGASAGSIVAALYSIGYSPNEIEKIFTSIHKNIIDYDVRRILTFAVGSFINKKVPIDGFVRGNRLERLIEYYANGKKSVNIAQTKIPLAVSSVDINTSEIVMFTSLPFQNEDGIIYDNNVKISEAVRASISFPGIFRPKFLKGRRLVDGGVRENVPVSILKKMGADKVVAVNLGYCGEHDAGVDNVLEIVSQTIDIMAYSVFKAESKDIDVLLKPKIYNVKLLEVDKISQCIKRGYDYACGMIPNIKRIL